MDTSRIEPRALGEAPEDEEGPRSRQPTTARVEEELGTMAAVEIRPSA